MQARSNSKTPSSDPPAAGDGHEDRDEIGEVAIDEPSANGMVELTTRIVCAYVGRNVVASADLPALIGDVHDALGRAAGRRKEHDRPEQKAAVNWKKSVFPDHIICLEDGKKFKSLKRHLRTHYDLSPEEYREKWGLAADYPMVAPNYAAARSALAKKMGLGQQRRRKA